SITDIAGYVPESIRGMIQRTIDLLGETDRRLLNAASVQGHEFDAAVVARVVGVEPADAEEQLDTIDRIHGLVRRAREQELPDAPERRRQELAILMSMGVAANASRGFSSPEVQEIYDRAGTLCVEFNETEQLARVLYGQIQFHTVRLQLESVQEAADRIEHLA